MITKRKALGIAIEAITEKRRRDYAFSAEAAGTFHFGDVAKAKYDELTEAIEILQDLAENRERSQYVLFK